ncbi:MAG: site-2 protease family protein [Planctomycetaceae bacterium]
MLGQVNETEFDLRFWLFGIPVRVHPGFWIVALIMGSGAFRSKHGLALVGIWVACLFVSILVHEMGHALVIKRFRWEPHVVLHYFGGYAAYVPTWGQTPWRSIAISLAGPGAGFVLFGLVLGVEKWHEEQVGPPNVFLQDAFFQLKWINLIWGIVNLLPVLPLDGGQIAREVYHLIRVREPWNWTLKTGMLVSALVAVFFLNLRLYYPALLFGFFCFQNFQMYQQYRGGGYR